MVAISLGPCIGNISARCSYSEEEMAPLKSAMAAVTRMKCFHMVMEYSCRNYVTQLIKELMMMPAS